MTCNLKKTKQNKKHLASIHTKTENRILSVQETWQQTTALDQTDYSARDVGGRKALQALGQ